ncbi:MAG: amidohydrolase [Pseudomonadales bacterium]
MKKTVDRHHPKKFRWLLNRTAVSSLLLLSSTVLAQSNAPADLVFIGKHIITMEGPEPRRQRKAQALAVTGEHISWMGTAEQAAQHIGPETEVIELKRRALLPGFIDAHGHVTFQAFTISLANVASPPVGPVTDIASLLATLVNYMDENNPEPGSWIVGNGYDDSLLKESRHPTRQDLDQVSGDHPLALMHVSGHLVAANSKALQLAGISADSDDPEGGHIRRIDGSNEPNGVLEETAANILRPFMFAGQTNPLESLQQALALYASHGTTTVQDGATGQEVIPLIKAAADAGILTQDLIYYPVVQDATPIPAEWQVGEYQNRAKAGGVKMVLDGSPQGKTAFLSAPYHVPPDGKDASYRGYPIHPAERVTAMVKHYINAGVPILAHANGDAAADMLIDAVAAAEHQKDHRTVMIHAQTVREDQLDDMAELKIIPSFFSAHTFFWGDWHRDSVLGPERGARISPTRSAMDRNIPFTVHNDAPIVPPDMTRLLWASSNRKTRSGKTLGKEQRLRTYEALLAVTRNAAHQAFEEDRKGTLAVGKLADLVVLSRNPLTTAPRRLLALEVEGTWSHGRQIYSNTPE